MILFGSRHVACRIASFSSMQSRQDSVPNDFMHLYGSPSQSISTSVVPLIIPGVGIVGGSILVQCSPTCLANVVDGMFCRSNLPTSKQCWVNLFLSVLPVRHLHRTRNTVLGIVVACFPFQNQSV